MFKHMKKGYFPYLLTFIPNRQYYSKFFDKNTAKDFPKFYLVFSLLILQIIHLIIKLHEIPS